MVPAAAGASVVGIDVLHEPRQLVRGGAYGPKRLLVVHPQRAEKTDGAEGLIRQPVCRTDECQLMEARGLELVADADERAPRVERLCQDVQESGALLERVHQAAVRPDLLRAEVVEEICRTADVQVPVFLGRVLERRANRGEERALGRR